MFAHESKVFGIGLPRTGTTSLNAALNRLGFRSVHFPFVLYGAPDHHILEQYEGFVDSPLPLLYRDFDVRFPGSKFVLTLRPLGSWLQSMAWLLNEGRVLWAWDEDIDRYHRELLGTDRFEPPVLERTCSEHVAGIRHHFRDRPEDLLEFDAFAGDGYPALCQFLGVPDVPDPYPRGNARRNVSMGARLTYRARRAAHRLMQRWRQTVSAPRR